VANLALPPLMGKMSAKKELSVVGFKVKLQEEADKVATEWNEEKIEVIHLHVSTWAYSREGAKLGGSILQQALARVSKEYQLKVEEEPL
jgi:hypothetical protein